MKLRPYQEQAVKEIISLISEGKKYPLLYLITGAGKTHIAQAIIQNYVSNTCKFLFVVRRRRLVDQTYRRFKRAFPNHICSILMSGRKSYWHNNAHICIASIDTLHSRKESTQVKMLMENTKVLFVDEAHDSTSKTYKSVLDMFKNCKIIGMTATPFTIGGKVHDFWDSVVHPLKPVDAIKQGVLCPMDFYSPPSHIVYKNLKVSSTGDYTNDSLFKAVDDVKIYGSFEKYFTEYGLNKKSIIFCVNINHSKKIESILKDKFKLKNVLRIDSELDDFEQRKCEERLNRYILNGEDFCVITVDMFTTGIDIPCLEVGFMLRPTKSVIVWYQQIGRLMRIHPQKQKAIILDFTKNSLTLAHPFIFDRKPDLKKDITKNMKTNTVPMKICKKCFIHYDSKLPACPLCNEAPEKGTRDREIKFDETVELVKMKEIRALNKEIKEEIKPEMNNNDWLNLHKKYGDSLFDSNLISKKTKDFIRRYNSIDIDMDFVKTMM